jgi:hypothetical protein
MQTDPIQYDFSKPAAALNQKQVSGGTPYGAGVDSVSGGLREDRPQVRTELTWNIRYEERSRIGCMSFDKVNVTIHLKPKIYVAREFNVGQCREEILVHERKHVEVDRKVMNKYAVAIGNALQKTVNDIGPIGPFHMDRVEEMKSSVTARIERAIDEQTALMDADMRREQAKVDTLEEYRRVSGFCRDIKVPAR